jgi:multidrug efflux pump subunit AcrA (membrane-fusion protein)
MSEEIQTQEPAATDAMQRSIEALERKNQELIAELRTAKSKKLPDGVDVDELLEFKRRAEQSELESQGKYSEARQALEQQYREATAQKDQRITELESRVRELELVTPAVTALADLVHDPDMVLKTKLSSDQIEREPDGTVVVVDGYQRTPVSEWAKTLPAWMQKQPRPQGSGAQSGRSSGEMPLGIKNPFAQESFNLTEQSRLFRTDRDMYERLKAAATR